MAQSDESPATAGVTHPLEVIAEGGPWRAALFTTFALSLGFFDTEVLARLIQARCDKTWVVADVFGVRASLMERQSLAVGSHYELIAVAGHRGVFHPKCVYLWAAEESANDVLLIGSGNLTFGGYGGNFEVCEVLSSDLHPRAFSDFAAFLSLLTRAPHFTVSNTSPLLQVAARSAQFLEHAPGAPAYPRLIHTVEEGALTQLARIAAPLNPHTLTVVSPFHHPTGAPIRALAESLKVQHLKVAVPGYGTTCSFPFGIAAGWTVPATAVRLTAAGAQRRLHAKWYEILCDEKLVTLTGSVNATATALDSTDNAEVGVVREAPFTTALVVTPTVPLTFVADTWEPAATGRPVVTAALYQDGVLSGQLLACANPAGTWQLSIHGPGQPDWHGPATTVAFDARFETRVEILVNPDAGSLELRLTRDNEVARGWLNFPDHLAFSHAERARRHAAKRIRNHTSTAEDLVNFLRWLQHETDLLLTPTTAREPGTGEQNMVTSIPVTVGSFAARAFDPAQQQVHSPSAAAVERASSSEQARQLLALFMGLDPTTGAVLPPRPRDDELDDSDDIEEFDGATAPSRSQQRKKSDDSDNRKRRTLDEFERQVSAQLSAQVAARRRDRAPPAALARALEYWGAAVLGYRAIQMGDRAAALTAAQRWFIRATSMGPLVCCESNLDTLVLGVGLVLAAEAPVVVPADPVLRYLEMTADAVHQRLEAYYGGSVHSDHAQACLRRFLALPLGVAVAAEHAETLASKLAAFSDAPTARSALAQLLGGQMSFADLAKEEASKASVGQTLFRPQDLALLRDPTNLVAVSCPKHCVCGLTIRADDLVTLRHRHLFQCLGCRRVLIDCGAAR